MELHLKIIGFSLILLGLIHGLFPTYFNWKKDLANLEMINREMMIIHTFFIALTVILMGILCVTSAQSLIHTNLGQKISLGLTIFWGFRLIFQFFGYSSDLWNGKKLETIIHILFIAIWTYYTAIFSICASKIWLS